MSNEGNPQAIGYFRFNKKEQLSDPDRADVYMPSCAKTKRVWRARATSKTYPAPPWDRETEHLKNVAKKKGLGIYKVNSPEQRIAVKEWWAEFDRANRVTMDDIVAAVRKLLDDERAFLERRRITQEGLTKI